jgi:hypothetical protein
MFLIPNEYWEVKTTNNRGRGIFCKKDIPPGTIIGDYLGKIIPEESQNKSLQVYGMCYGRNTDILPDNKSIGIHLINSSCMPNCGMFPLKDHTLYAALRKIYKGEELTVNYYMLYETDDNYDYLCKCGTPLCHGSLCASAEKIDSFVEYEKKIRGKYFLHPTKSVGQTLELLSDYPKTMPDLEIHDLYGCLGISPYKLEINRLGSVRQIRKLIRKTGQTLAYPKLGLRVIGVTGNIILTSHLNN